MCVTYVYRRHLNVERLARVNAMCGRFVRRHVAAQWRGINGNGNAVWRRLQRMWLAENLWRMAAIAEQYLFGGHVAVAVMARNGRMCMASASLWPIMAANNLSSHCVLAIMSVATQPYQ